MQTIKHFSTLLVLLLSLTVAAQPFSKYSTSSKAAIKSYEDGLKYYDAKNYDAAIKELRQSLSKDSAFMEALILLASVYEDYKMNDEAIAVYIKSFNTKPDFFPNNYLRCAQLELKKAMYDQALIHFEKYSSYSSITSFNKKQAEHGIANCKFAIDAMQHPVPFNPENLGAGINSKFSEYYSSFTVDQKTIIFTRDIEDKESMFGHQEDFYKSEWKEGKWQTALPLNFPLNTKDNEGAPTVSADGRILFFTGCNREGGQGSCDIYLSQLNGAEWTKPFNVGLPLNTNGWESQPSFSSDGKTLYFVRGISSRKGGQTDIYYSVFQQDRTWSEPKQLSEKINTSGNEESVFIHPDNQTLYFSSNGHTGMGGLDIYMSRKDSSGEWSDPVNLGYPINTSNDENSLVVSADGQKAYFASDRTGGFGGLDIYSFDLYQNARPLLTSYVKAKVIDAATSLPLAAGFEIIDIETGKVIVKNTTDKMRGEFLACLPTGKNYLLNVNKEQYLFHSENFECKNATDKQQAYNLTIALKKPSVGESVVLKNIFFAVNKFDLEPESAIELQKLISFLNNNPTSKIEISGHTDNTGDKKMNQLLSENRAKSVYDYLITNKIDKQRLTYKGYGDALPLVTNETEEGRAQNRRTAFKITGL